MSFLACAVAMLVLARNDNLTYREMMAWRHEPEDPDPALQRLWFWIRVYKVGRGGTLAGMALIVILGYFGLIS